MKTFKHGENWEEEDEVVGTGYNRHGQLRWWCYLLMPFIAVWVIYCFLTDRR